MVEDEDETLFTLAENLGNLLDCIGGPHYASYLLPALEKLGGIDDTTVRDKVIISALSELIGYGGNQTNCSSHWSQAIGERHDGPCHQDDGNR